MTVPGPLNVLVTTPPLIGPFRSLVPLSWAVRAAGHTVLVAGLPNIADEVAAAGLPAIVAADPLDVPALLAELDGEESNRLRALVRFHARAATTLLDGTLNTIRAVRPDVVVHTPYDLAGSVLAAVLDRPAVVVTHGLAPREGVAGGFRRGVEALLGRYGVAEHDRQPVLTLDTWPPAAAGEPMRHVPYHGAPRRPDWLAEPPARPRVCVTVSAEPPHPRLVPLVLEWAAAVAGDDREVVVPLPDPALAPAGVRVTEWASLDQVVVTCAAVVHCADPFAALTCLAAGVPQVLVPITADGSRHADALAESGVGVAVDRYAAVESLPAAVDQAARLEVAAAAASIAAMPAPAGLVARIEGLATIPG